MYIEYRSKYKITYAPAFEHGRYWYYGHVLLTIKEDVRVEYINFM